jgi:phytoene dehydrogenase-like protein
MYPMAKTEFDAVVVGSGPNGLAAAITMQQAGLEVLLVEGEQTVGGGMRSAELTLPGFIHDVCSAIHPMALASPFFSSVPLQNHGLEFIYPPFAAAHPLDNGRVAILEASIHKTAGQLGSDRDRYLKLMGPLVKRWPLIAHAVFNPWSIPSHPLDMAQFALKALLSARHLADRFFEEELAKGMFAGMAAHGMLRFTDTASSAAALALMIQGHLQGWPLVKKGSQQLANALCSYFLSLGGKLETKFPVNSLHQLPTARAILLDVTPEQLLRIAGNRLSALYRWQLTRFQYGMGVYKLDWALDSPIPFQAEACKLAGTVHLGGSFADIEASEKMVFEGSHPQKPFVLLAQQSLFDPTRAPAGKHTAWAYCHVPHGSTVSMREAIENQIERFAPGFRERVLATHVMDPAQLQAYNPNYIGGDILGGKQDLSQLFTRPALRFSPYRTSAKGIYLCSSSTPPGAGVHGMCGYHAATRSLRDIFKLQPAKL